MTKREKVFKKKENFSKAEAPFRGGKARPFGAARSASRCALTGAALPPLSLRSSCPRRGQRLKTQKASLVGGKTPAHSMTDSLTLRLFCAFGAAMRKESMGTYRNCFKKRPELPLGGLKARKTIFPPTREPNEP